MCSTDIDHLCALMQQLEKEEEEEEEKEKEEQEEQTICPDVCRRSCYIVH